MPAALTIKQAIIYPSPRFSSIATTTHKCFEDLASAGGYREGGGADLAKGVKKTGVSRDLVGVTLNRLTHSRVELIAGSG